MTSPRFFSRPLLALAASIAWSAFASVDLGAADRPNIPAKQSDAIHILGFDLPQSQYLSAESVAVLAQHRPLWAAAFNNSCGALEGTPSHLADVRACQADAFYGSAIYQHVRDRYPVVIKNERIAGIFTEVFTPLQGIAAKNRHRVLINLHGGGFLEGSRTVSHLESIPIAAMSGIEVISIDYRQAPEAKFPAATEDVAAVYRELLKTHAPESIGIYGCSAGGLLTAETMAWLKQRRLPMPGAIGMFCMGASYTGMGDSSYIARAIEASPADEFAPYFAYFIGTDSNDPRAFPAASREALLAFPPSLMISGTRDHALSSVINTHARLSALGVESDLHVFEGLGHAFFYDPDLPESHEVYALVSRFFDAHLKAGK